MLNEELFLNIVFLGFIGALILGALSLVVAAWFVWYKILCKLLQ